MRSNQRNFSEIATGRKALVKIPIAATLFPQSNQFPFEGFLPTLLVYQIFTLPRL